VSVAPVSRSTRVIPVADIDAPELDARLGRDPEKLEELARDILRRGLIEPIKVFVKGDRFEVIDGFRRFLATKSAGLTEIECFVFPLEGGRARRDQVRGERVPRRHEPRRRGDHVFLAAARRVRGRHRTLCALVNKKLSYVDNRLALVNGDELVFEAVKDRKSRSASPRS
jgi:ParB/RepB/Spo0J family partition protein